MTDDPKTSTETGNQAPDDLPNVQFDDDMEPGEPVQPEEKQLPAEPAQDDKTDQRITTTPTGKETEPLINQEAVNKRINEITFEKHEERRRREDAEAKAKKFEEELQQLRADRESVIVPPMPDPYDDDYETKIRHREEAIQKLAENNARKAIAEQNAQQAMRDMQAKRAEKIQGHVNKMFAAAEEYKIAKSDMERDDRLVAQYVRDPGIAEFILGQKTAPLIVRYLAGSAQELEKIGQMDPINAAAYIATTIVPAADKLKPGMSKAPEPLEIPKGKGAPENKNPFLDGVVLE